MKERRGICPECGQQKAVTARGVMRQHLPPRTEGSGQFRDVCSGTGDTPVSLIDDCLQIPVPYPGDERATMMEPGGWIVNLGEQGILVETKGTVCAVPAPNGRFICTRDHWPHEWHISESVGAAGGAIRVMAVWHCAEVDQVVEAPR